MVGAAAMALIAIPSVYDVVARYGGVMHRLRSMGFPGVTRGTPVKPVRSTVVFGPSTYSSGRFKRTEPHERKLHTEAAAVEDDHPEEAVLLLIES
ncbi:hypothetical protein ABZP36_030177 [Zizania latifolia]